jgi:2-isopropylmalate synthase
MCVRRHNRFKELADKKKEITNMDLESIVNDEAQDLTSNRFKLVHIQVWFQGS